MKRIFISYAEEYGRQFAHEVKAFIDEITNNDKIAFFDKRSIPNSTNWINKIKSSIDEATHFIGLMDVNYFTRFYSALEYGYSLKNINLKHFLLLVDYKMDLRECPVAINQLSASNKIEDRVESLSRYILNALYGPKILENPHLTKRTKEFEKNIKSLIIGSFQYKAVYEELREIDRLSFECLKSFESSPLGNIALISTKILKNTRNRLKELNIGKITLDKRSEIREFWEDTILENVQKSIWTTNAIGTFGRSVYPSYINKQKTAVENRGVEITRVFIFDETSSSEIIDLYKLITHQINKIPGIRLFVISRSRYIKFKNRINEAGLQEDFMIIDDQSIYLTYVDYSHGLEDRITQTQFSRSYDEIVISQLQRDIQIKSTNVKQVGVMNSIIVNSDKPKSVRTTCTFFDTFKIPYTLSRNRNAEDCKDAARKRFRNEGFGIPLEDELKTMLGLIKSKQSTKLVIINLPGNKKFDQHKLRIALGVNSHIQIAPNEFLEKFNLEFGTVNPFIITALLEDDKLKSQFEDTIVIFDKSLLEKEKTMMTNAGDKTWGIEFEIDKTVPCFNNVVFDKSITQE